MALVIPMRGGVYYVVLRAVALTGMPKARRVSILLTEFAQPVEVRDEGVCSVWSPLYRLPRGQRSVLLVDLPLQIGDAAVLRQLLVRNNL